MLRKAILIVYKSKTDEVKLPVSNNVAFMKAYLQLREGGHWLSSEIVVLIHPNSKQLLSYFKDLKEDFRLVYFSGRGVMSSGEQYINLGDELVNIKKLLCKKEMFIFDCCRTASNYKYISMKYRITEATLKADKIQIRMKYEQLIKQPSAKSR